MERKEEFNLKIKNDNTEKLRDLEKIKAFECVLKYSEVDSLVKFSYVISIMNSMKKEQKKFQSIQSVSSVFLQKDYFTPDLLLLLMIVQTFNKAIFGFASKTSMMSKWS